MHFVLAPVRILTQVVASFRSRAFAGILGAMLLLLLLLLLLRMLLLLLPSSEPMGLIKAAVW